MKILSRKNIGYALLVVGVAAVAGVQLLGSLSSSLVLSPTVALVAGGAGAYMVWGR